MLRQNLQPVHLCSIRTFKTTKLFTLALIFLSLLFTKQLFSCHQFKKIDISEFNKDIGAAFFNVENLDLDSIVQFFNSTWLSY